MMTEYTVVKLDTYNDDIPAWLWENIPQPKRTKAARWKIHGPYIGQGQSFEIHFLNPEDAVLFALRWM
jgi:hypothetical protein